MARGISNGVRLKINFLVKIVFEAHRKRMIRDTPHRSHILLSSNSSDVVGNITRGTAAKIK